MLGAIQGQVCGENKDLHADLLHLSDNKTGLITELCVDNLF
jgi:hypothetical protein